MNIYKSRATAVAVVATSKKTSLCNPAAGIKATLLSVVQRHGGLLIWQHENFELATPFSH